MRNQALWILQKLGRTSLAQPLNTAVRLAYLRKLTPYLEQRLRLKAGVPGLRLITRHSVHEKTVFNVFASDLDLSLLVPDEIPGARISELVSSYQAWKARLPFLGELEVYRDAEWELKQRAFQESQGVIEFFTWVRKLAWQRAELEKASTPYHHDKARAAIKRIGARLGASGDVALAVQGFLARFLNSEWVEEAKRLDEKPVYSKFLELDPQALGLAPEGLAMLAAFCPDGNFILPDSRELLRRLRSFEPIGRIYQASCLYELMVCRSVLRTRGADDSSGMGHWMRFLEAELGSVALPLA